MKKNKKKIETVEKESGIRPQTLDESVMNEQEQEHEYNVQFMKLLTGEEIVSLVEVMMTFETHNTEPQTTFMLSYPMEVVNMSLDGQPTVLFKPWISNVLVSHSTIPLKERVIMTHVAMEGRIKENYLRYVAARQLERIAGKQVEVEATFH